MRIILILFCCILFTNCYTKERNCNDFKTGNFEFQYIENGIEKNGKITRNDSMQTEVYDGKSHKSSVRWINDCEVIFKTINPTNMAERKDIHLKILTTAKDSYTFEYSYVGETKKLKGVAYKK